MGLLQNTHLRRFFLIRLCGVLLWTPPRSFVRALHLGILQQSLKRSARREEFC